MTDDPQPTSVVTAGHKRRRLVEPQAFEWEVGGTTYRTSVPADGHGFEVSAPRPLRALMGLLAPWYALEDVSSAHDYLYRKQGVNAAKTQEWVQHGGLGASKVWRTTTIDRKTADAIMLSDPHDPLWLRYAAYAYVRAFGWWPWHDVGERIWDWLTGE
jgi:hypothetical protein